MICLILGSISAGARQSWVDVVTRVNGNQLGHVSRSRGHVTYCHLATSHQSVHPDLSRVTLVTFRDMSLLLLLPGLALGLRVSDAWVDDIERLEPATSTRVETYMFPAAASVTRDADTALRSRGVAGEGGRLLEPLYFKFKHKHNGKVVSIPMKRSFAGDEHHGKFPFQGSRLTAVATYNLVGKIAVFRTCPSTPKFHPTRFPAASSSRSQSSSYRHCQEAAPHTWTEDGLPSS